MNDWADELAADWFTLSPRFRNKTTLAEALRSVRRRANSDVAAWHTRQAKTMRAILTDIERGVITSVDPDTTRKWISHHEYCAAKIANQP